MTKINKTTFKYFAAAILLITAAVVCFMLIRSGTTQNNTHPKLSFDSGNITLIKTLKASDDSSIGNIYVTYINNGDIFSSLYIVQQIQGQNAVIFKATNEGIFNTQGKLLGPVDNFYGYEISLLKNDYFVIHALSDQGKSLSDDLTIKWNYVDKIFEIQWPPTSF